MLHHHNLFQAVLGVPYAEGADEIRIISGYATSSMAERHLSAYPDLKLKLIVGMCSREGLSWANHLGFQRLVKQKGETFSCMYNTDIANHSKLYIWYKNGVPFVAFLGSANYTQRAFFLDGQNEILASCDPTEADKYFNECVGKCIACNDSQVSHIIQLYCSLDYFKAPAFSSKHQHVKITGKKMDDVELPLIDHHGNVPVKSGLNWGQRAGRDHNQAYLAVPSSVARAGFFPPRTIHFNVLTDDGYTIKMVVAQDGDKALHSPDDNSEIGRYFRARLGLKDGELVTREDLDRYGRTSVKFMKDDDENFYLDFSVHRDVVGKTLK